MGKYVIPKDIEKDADTSDRGNIAPHPLIKSKWQRIHSLRQ